MRQYRELCEHILLNGKDRKDRTGTGTRGVFGYQMRFDLQEGFPLLTTKDMSERRWVAIVEELLWFISGETNIIPLLEKGVNIWNHDAYRWFKKRNPDEPMSYEQYIHMLKTHEDHPDFVLEGDLGRIYGKQWRSWWASKDEWSFDAIDQIANVIESIKKDPYSRRHIVSAWNPAELDEMALPPCHTLFQFYVQDDLLSCQLYQRSGDVFLGVPFNIASYALLTHIVAHLTGYQVGEFIHTLGDAHIYLNHIEQIQTQLQREPRNLPRLTIQGDIKDINDFTFDSFLLEGYDPYGELKGKVSVGK